MNFEPINPDSRNPAQWIPFCTWLRDNGLIYFNLLAARQPAPSQGNP